VGARRADDLDEIVLQCRPDVAIVAGVAAALKPGLKTGEVLVAESVSDARQNSHNRIIGSDLRLVQIAGQCGARRVNQLVTAGQVVRTPEEKRELAHAGDAVEMESFWIMQKLSRELIPAVAIRAVADTVWESVPYDFEPALDSDGQIRILRLFPQIVSRPWALPQAVRFGLICRRATIRLAAYLDSLARRLAAEALPPPLLATSTL
jgi:hypothetical protein